MVYFTACIGDYMTSDILFSEDLKHNNIDNWKKILNHDFIIEIVEDILPIGKFIFYLKQDQIFLEAFCNLLAAASRIAHDKETKVWFESLIDNTTRYEIPMQNEILHQLEGDVKFTGVSAEGITRDYISYMKRVSDSKDLAIIVPAMAPCPWTYYEISEALNKKNIRTDAFKQWIRFYSSKESRKQVSQLKTLLNKLARKSDMKKKTDMKNHFSISCNYELEFWNMAYSFF
jgi:thiaminase/transcriptional activator TenA